MLIAMSPGGSKARPDSCNNAIPGVNGRSVCGAVIQPLRAVTSIVSVDRDAGLRSIAHLKPISAAALDQLSQFEHVRAVDKADAPQRSALGVPQACAGILVNP